VTQAGAAAAVHEAVCEATGSDGAAHGDLYALAGARVVFLLTCGRGDISVVAGTLHHEGASRPDSWIARVPDGTEIPPLAEAQIFDFGLRHVGGLPDYFWGTPGGLGELGIVLEPDREATAVLLEGQPDQLAKRVTDRALELIAKRFPAD
jgi:hypothetical protein